MGMFIVWDTLRTLLRLLAFVKSKWAHFTWLYKIFFKKIPSKMQKTLFTNPHAPQATYRIPDLKQIGVLGTGTFGIVHLVVDKRDDKTYALKTIRKQSRHDEGELKTMAELDHPFIIQLHCMAKYDDNLHLLMECAMGGDLYCVMRKEGTLGVHAAQFYIASLVLALEYMHSKNVLYRDVKPENVLLDTDGYVKLTDFGMSKILESRTYTKCGTVEYMAPELIDGKGYGFEVDWWGCGILLYELLCGTTPFYSSDCCEMYENILTKHISFPRNVNLVTRNLITCLLHRDPLQRMNGQEMKHHAFFRNFNWEALQNKTLVPPFSRPIANPQDITHFAANTS